MDNKKFRKGDVVIVTKKDCKWQGEFRVVQYIDAFSYPAVELQFVGKNDKVVLPESYLELKSEILEAPKGKLT